MPAFLFYTQKPVNGAIDYAARRAGTEYVNPANVSVNYSYITYPPELWILEAATVLTILVYAGLYINKRKRTMWDRRFAV